MTLHNTELITVYQPCTQALDVNMLIFTTDVTYCSTLPPPRVITFTLTVQLPFSNSELPNNPCSLVQTHPPPIW